MGNSLKMVDEAFNKVTPLFVLPIYYPLAYPRGPKPSDALLDSTAEAGCGLRGGPAEAGRCSDSHDVSQAV